MLQEPNRLLGDGHPRLRIFPYLVYQPETTRTAG